jgi:GTPase SAR1 family protein
MSICGSGRSLSDAEKQELAKQKAQDKLVSQAIKESSTSNVIKLLLLGTGECGKSTIFKQMKLIYGAGFSLEETNRYKDVIYRNCLECIRILVNNMNKLGITYEQPNNAARADKIAKIPEQQVLLNAGSLLTPELGREIKAIWKDGGIQACFQRRSQFQLIDSADYYLDDIERIATPNYIPTEQDLLRSRSKTVGIVEEDFIIDKHRFKTIDVGGQRNERRKWIHAFDDVTCVVFITSLSEYDQKLVEHEDTWRMAESLMLFEEICEMKYFKNTPIILFFNKVDLFKVKIQKVDPKDTCFPDYTGGKNYDNALKYFQEEFLKKNKVRTRSIYSKETCATDKNLMRGILDTVKKHILELNLQKANLLSS